MKIEEVTINQREKNENEWTRTLKKYVWYKWKRSKCGIMAKCQCQRHTAQIVMQPNRICFLCLSPFYCKWGGRFPWNSAALAARPTFLPKLSFVLLCLHQWIYLHLPKLLFNISFSLFKSPKNDSRRFNLKEPKEYVDFQLWIFIKISLFLCSLINIWMMHR